MPKSKLLSSSLIRRTFLEYFLNNGHSYIKSSSVKPFGDASLEFVNAGMNQFKNVFLGLERIPCERAVNSQKCIRVGGKHNDLNAVGHDNYHHTFFEMLGNWSFNDYFKEDACRLAWKLLTTEPFSLDPNRLYVTYFGGDKDSKLGPDLETKELWLNIGVDEERILPFGLKDNFWEMGPQGPCGPCTEIHYDHIGTIGRPHVVNSGSPDLIELWNVVFIQYNRLADSRLEKLTRHFVDTGMGFERLVTLMQNKKSNYDTDIFSPYLSTISKFAGCRGYEGKFGTSDIDGIDTAYRILADHSRMITVALADNMFPNESHGLRRVVRKALLTADKFLPGNGVKLLTELTKVAGEVFAETFPETLSNQRQIQYIIEDENELWTEMKEQLKNSWKDVVNRYPELELLSDVQSSGLISSFKLLTEESKGNGTHIPSDVALTMYDRYGLNPQVIEQLANICGYSVNLLKLEEDVLSLREKNKALIYSTRCGDIPKKTVELVVSKFHGTDDSNKLKYFKDSTNCYYFDSLKCRVQTVLADGKPVDERFGLQNGSTVAVILEKTNLWASNNVIGDVGYIKLLNKEKHIGTVNVNRVCNIGGYIYHFGELTTDSEMSGSLLPNLEAEIIVDPVTRLNLMRNTTAAHLFGIALKKKVALNLQAFLVTPKYFSTTFLVSGKIINDDDIISVEKEVNNFIRSKIDIELTTNSINDIVSLSRLYIPPLIGANVKQLNIIKFKLNDMPRDVTFGPNVLNTLDIGEVCLVNVELKKRNREITIEGICGDNVSSAKKNAEEILRLLSFKETSQEDFKAAKEIMANGFVPWLNRPQIEERLNKFKSTIKKDNFTKQLESTKTLISKAEMNKKKYLVAFVGETSKFEKFIYDSATIPTLLYGLNRKHIVARCHIPKAKNSSAKLWMSEVAKQFNLEVIPSKKYGEAMYYIKPMKVNIREVEDVIKQFGSIAETTAQKLYESN